MSAPYPDFAVGFISLKEFQDFSQAVVGVRIEMIRIVKDKLEIQALNNLSQISSNLF